MRQIFSSCDDGLGSQVAQDTNLIGRFLANRDIWSLQLAGVASFYES